MEMAHFLYLFKYGFKYTLHDANNKTSALLITLFFHHTFVTRSLAKSAKYSANAWWEHSDTQLAIKGLMNRRPRRPVSLPADPNLRLCTVNSG